MKRIILSLIFALFASVAQAQWMVDVTADLIASTGEADYARLHIAANLGDNGANPSTLLTLKRLRFTPVVMDGMIIMLPVWTDVGGNLPVWHSWTGGQDLRIRNAATGGGQDETLFVDYGIVPTNGKYIYKAILDQNINGIRVEKATCIFEIQK